ncbi:MAG: VWA domain-containing protein [archaeon]|nr:VWA domain-containing protein [archaeon]
MGYKLLLAGLLLLIFGVYAHSADVSGTCGNDSLQCEITLNNMELCNDSTVTETYDAYFNGEYSQWFNVIPSQIKLAPGECSDLKVYTVANCYADPGFYTANLIIQDGETLSVTCELDLKQGHFVDIKVEPQSQNATQCEEKIYNLIVTNNTIVPNQQIERVDLSISGIPESWYVLEEERILVSKGESETVQLKVQAPCDAAFGAYDFTAKAALPNPNFFDEADGEYILDQGQSIQVLLDVGFDGKLHNACLEIPTKGKITLVNNGKLSDNLKITLDGPSFARLDKTQVSLGPGEKETLTIDFSETTQEPGEYDFTVRVESTVFDYATSKPFISNLQDCFNVEVIKLEGQSDVCVEDEPIYKFRVTNNKIMTVDLDVSIDGIEAELNKTKIVVGPGESKDFEALLDVKDLAREARVSKTDLAVELIIDTSGSMVERVNGHNKMETAKTSIINLVNKINEVDLGLRVLGQGELCEDSELLVKVDKLDIARITDEVSQLNPKGKTPLTQALRASAEDFPANKEKAIILVSDGKETCEGNIGETARELASKGIMVYSVGFDIDAEGKEQLQEISSRTKGKYFDAKNPEDLVDVLQKISQELDIVPSNEGKRTFTLNLDSDNFSYEKDFSLTISDCYNATMVAPELNLCPGVTKTDVVTLVNLGSETQDFKIDVGPNWIKTPEKVTIAPNNEEIIPLTALVPKNASEDSYTIKVTSGNVDLEQQKNINYLSNASCFGIDLILLEPQLDAATCEGKQQILIIENRGVVEQEVTITADKPYVEIVDKVISVKPGERKEVNFFVSPPFDLPETTFINISAVTERGFKTSAQIKLVVFGNQDSFGLGEVDVRVRDLNITKVEVLEHNLELVFDIYNDSNRTLEVFNVTSLDYNAIVQLDKRFIQAKRTVMARMLIDLPDEFTSRTITVPIKLETDEGTYTRNIVFAYTASDEPTQGEVEEPISIGTGLFSLATLSTALLGALILIVIGLVIYSAYRAVKNDDTEAEEKPKEEDESTKAAKAKLAELKAKKADKKPVKKATKKSKKK